MKKPKAKDRSKPDPDCRWCAGKGIWPEFLTLSPPLEVRVRAMEGHKDAIPCKRCHETN